MNERDKAREQAEVMLHFANGGEVEYSYTGDSFHVTDKPSWNWSVNDYRIKDPYRELKEAAKDPTKQIRILGGNWMDSDFPWTFDFFPVEYEIRDKPKPMKKVKLLAYYNGNSLFWSEKYNLTDFGSKRVPSEDKEIEVEE